MLIRISIAFLVFSMNLTAQAVNEKINVLLTQSAQLRVNAGYDVNLDEEGKAVLGNSVYLFGGTPDYSFAWIDELENYYFKKSPEVTLTGKYILTVTDQKNCTAADSLTVFPFGTGVSKNYILNKLTVRYDPASNQLTVYSPFHSDMQEMRIVDLKGRELAIDPQELIKGSEPYQINLGRLEPGVYIVYLRGSYSAAVAKFIIQ